MAKKSINVGIIGFGTVGTGTARILIENADIIRSAGSARRLCSKKYPIWMSSATGA